MGRSYLYGRDTKTLTAQEYALEKLYDQIDRPGYRITPQEFFKSPEFAQYLDQNFGSLADQVPPGSQIVNQTPFKLEYRDAEGYTHTLTRKETGGPNLGNVTRQTDRPSILPQSQTQQSTLDMLRQRVQQGYTQPAQFAALPPEVQAQLDAISAAERGDIARQAADARGQLVAQLYGNKVNQSSIADDQSARFLEALGRVQQQQAAGAAQRTLGLQQFLANLNQQQNEGAANLYANLSGQGTQRDIAGAGLDLDKLRLNEASRQFNASNYLDTLRTQLAQQEVDQANSPFNKFLRGLSAAGALTGGIGTLYGALTYGRKNKTGTGG